MSLQGPEMGSVAVLFGLSGRLHGDAVQVPTPPSTYRSMVDGDAWVR
jgi:hypothetical protein